MAHAIGRPDTARWLRRRAVAALVALAAALPSYSGQAQVELRLNRIESFVPRFEQKRRMNKIYRPELTELQAEIHLRLKTGQNMSCSSQIFKEAHWLTAVGPSPRVEARPAMATGKLGATALIAG